MSGVDVVALRNFYASPLGQVVQRVLGGLIRERWGSSVGLSIAGLGYAAPYLGPLRADAVRTLALMPAEQGCVHWPPPGEPNATALVDADALPLPSSSLDRVLLVHMLEVAHHPIDLLREVWRVLDGGGRLLMIVPARRGWWASAEWTPFGHGHPYTKGQLTQLLREAWFSPLDWTEALYMLPSNRTTLVRSAHAFERIGRTIAFPFAGVHVVEATKQVYSAVPARRSSRAAVLSPAALGVPVRREHSRD